MYRNLLLFSFPIHMLNYSHAQTHASFEMNQNQIKQLFWHINDFFQALCLSLERERNSHKAYIDYIQLVTQHSTLAKVEDKNFHHYFSFLGHFVHRHSSIVIANWFFFLLWFKIFLQQLMRLCLIISWKFLSKENREFHFFHCRKFFFLM